jgi:hypothetical protein
MKRKGRGRKKSGGGGARRWLTVLLFFLIGFFAVSIYMGRTGRARVDTAKTARPAALDLPRVKIPEAGSPTVVILNGCGRVGLGGRVERWLRRSGIDVFETRNADNSNYDKTIIVARSGRPGAAEQVEQFLRKSLGVGLLITERKSVPEADVLLILGRDFPDSLPGFDEGLAAPER